MTQSNSNHNGKTVEQLVNTVMGVKAFSDSASLTNAKSQTTALDWKALITYKAGTLLQIGLLILSFWGMNWVISLSFSGWFSSLVAGLFFTLLSIRSRLFSPLDNTRSRRTYDQVIRPQWAPPPLAFPVIWMAIAVLRVISSLLVWQELNQNFLTLPLIAFGIHLALGDTWNTIFTVESRLGAGVPAVIFGPWLSAIVVTLLYWQVNPIAGLILAPACVWLTIATILVISIWRLNGSEPLYPLQR
ncbi:TspO/MBR family protein [Gloeocapsa sp. PCC 73106]|uniref:TspO/MBR family protein n=1 Tax=Gloeocapsa sp. PCC 73106 TaxID=102232 RepID=UPI0002AC4CAF|nr:tryptophan-rich sensory protein [Gloeocapsa sp. PCC 73106]ELR99722.1 tryptophan-rich sensory protein [Gloeocapsa sp. PCC 73106]